MQRANTNKSKDDDGQEKINNDEEPQEPTIEESNEKHEES